MRVLVRNLNHAVSNYEIAATDTAGEFIQNNIVCAGNRSSHETCIARDLEPVQGLYVARSITARRISPAR